MLRGNIQNFGLADVLQLIVKTQKSGVFVSRNGQAEVRVTFSRGWVVDVASGVGPNDAELGHRLVRAGLLSEIDLNAALRRSADAPLAEVLTRAGYVSEEYLRPHATRLATDTLFEIFTWPRGTYEFHEGLFLGRTSIDPISGELILMQGIVLIDEWPTIVQRIPSLLCFIERRWALPPEEGPTLLFASQAGLEPEVAPEERAIHALCVPGTEVETIIEAAPFHRFEVLRCLSHLIGAHYVRLAEPE